MSHSPQPAALDAFRLGDRTVRPRRGTVTGPDGTVRLEPKAMDLLLALASRSGEVVSRKALLRRVWPDTFVSDVGLKRNVFHLRKALGDDARRPTVIETLRKRGYRLCVPAVPVHRFQPPAPPASPAVAVMPFATARPDDDLTLGLAERLTLRLFDRLARRGRPRLASWRSVRAVAALDLDARETADRLGVSAIVEGTVWIDAGTPHLSVAVTDGNDGLVLWSRVLSLGADDDRDGVVRQIADALRFEAVRGADRSRHATA